MRAAVVVALALLCPSLIHALNCTGTTPRFDAWCNDNCNHEGVQQCPRQFCTCEGDPVSTVSCHAVNLFSNFPFGDQWCQLSCNFEPAFCPASYCACDDSAIPTPTLLDVSEHVPTCCDNELRFIFYSDAGHVYKRQVGSSTFQLCYDLPGGNPTSLLVDQDDNLWIADPVLGVVFRASTSCDANSLEVITSWAVDGKIDRPSALVFADGTLFITGSAGVWAAQFAADGSLFSLELVSGLSGLPEDFHIRDAEVVHTVAGDFLLFISADARIVFVNLNGPGQGNVIPIHFQNQTPDIGGLTITPCGLYYTVPDSNQIFFCPDGLDLIDPTGVNGIPADACFPYCELNGLDSHTCNNTREPSAIHHGCCCDVYITNPGNGCLTQIRNDGFTDGNGPFVPELVHCDLVHPNAVTFWIPPGSPVGCPSTCDPAPPSPSASPSPSPTVRPATTGRLVPGINLQFAGGVTQAAVATGTAVIQLIKCPEGVVLEGLTDDEKSIACPALPANTWKVPVSQLFIRNNEGDAVRVTDATPFLSAVASAAGRPVCMFHTEPIINRAGATGICDATCMSSNEGQVNEITCLGIDLPVADAKNRARDGATNILSLHGTPGTVTAAQITDNDFQSASTNICDGDVIAEFSINLMNVQTGASVGLNVLSQPRFDIADSCDAASTLAPRLCYDTTLTPHGISTHGVFGDGPTGSIVCVNEFFFQVGDSVFTVDPSMPPRVGDIIDTSFGVNGRSTGCLASMNVAPFNQFCGSRATPPLPNVSRRLCLVSPC